LTSIVVGIAGQRPLIIKIAFHLTSCHASQDSERLELLYHLVALRCDSYRYVSFLKQFLQCKNDYAIFLLRIIDRHFKVRSSGCRQRTEPKDCCQRTESFACCQRAECKKLPSIRNLETAVSAQSLEIATSAWDPKPSASGTDCCQCTESRDCCQSAESSDCCQRAESTEVTVSARNPETAARVQSPRRLSVSRAQRTSAENPQVVLFPYFV